MRPRAGLRARAAALLASWLLTFGMGCTAEQPATTTTMARSDHTISMFEFGFGPSTLVAEAGSTSVLRLRNDGILLHDWAILSTPITSEAELRPDDVIASTRVEPGAVVILDFDARRLGPI